MHLTQAELAGDAEIFIKSLEDALPSGCVVIYDTTVKTGHLAVRLAFPHEDMVLQAALFIDPVALGLGGDAQAFAEGVVSFAADFDLRIRLAQDESA